MTGSRDVSVYLDFISPYAYLGWQVAQRVAARRGLVLHPRPILFAGLLNAHGQKGPAEIAPKRAYTFKHVVRLAADHEIPIRPPFGHPFNPILPLRVALASEGAATDVLFRSIWVEGREVHQTEVMHALLDEAGFDGQALVAAASTPEVKQNLRSETESAVARGVFGVPTFAIRDELFWGQDSLPHLERWLDGEDPAQDADGWSDLPVVAHRPQLKS